MRRVIWLAAFSLVALHLFAVPANAVGGGVVSIGCTFSHAAADDPIVFPAQPGAAHMHNFLGNRSTDAFSTLDSLKAADTSCKLSADTAAY